MGTDLLGKLGDLGRRCHAAAMEGVEGLPQRSGLRWPGSVRTLGCGVITNRTCKPLNSLPDDKQVPSSWAMTLLLFLASLCLFLLGNGQHAVWDRDEPRYCQATRQLLRDGDWVVPRYNDGIRYDKPILTYWLQAPSFVAFGPGEFAGRFHSAVLGAARVAVVHRFALALGCTPAGAGVAATAAMLMALMMVVSKAATTDSTLVLTVVVMLWAVWELRREFRWGWHAAFWIALGFSVLVKGPPGVLVAWSAIVLLALIDARRVEYPGFARSALRSAAGMGLFLLVALPWAVMAWVRTEGDFFLHSIGHHVIDRVREPAEGHSGPFFYYLAVLPVAALPLTPLLVPAVRWWLAERARPELLFLAAWFVPSFIVFSLVKTKLPHYIAPLLPALALLLGLWWSAGRPWMERPSWRMPGTVLLVLLGLGVLALPLGVAVKDLPGIMVLPLTAVAVVLGAGSLVAALRWQEGRVLPFMGWMIGAWLLVAALALTVALPMADKLRPSRAMANWLHANLPPGTRVVAVEYQEPSLYFYWGSTVLEVGRGQPAQGFALLNDVSRPTALVTTADRWMKFQREYDGPVSPAIRQRHAGRYFQFEKGRWIDLVVVGNW